MRKSLVRAWEPKPCSSVQQASSRLVPDAFVVFVPESLSEVKQSKDFPYILKKRHLHNIFLLQFETAS